MGIVFGEKEDDMVYICPQCRVGFSEKPGVCSICGRGLVQAPLEHVKKTCVEQFVEVCVRTPTPQVFVGWTETEGKIIHSTVDDVWDEQQDSLKLGYQDVIWLKKCYETMADVNTQKKLLCVLTELYAIMSACRVSRLHSNHMSIIIKKWGLEYDVPALLVDSYLFEYAKIKGLK